EKALPSDLKWTSSDLLEISSAICVLIFCVFEPGCLIISLPYVRTCEFIQQYGLTDKATSDVPFAVIRDF
ncbi:hypothetical protein, partial [Hafnia paralvei]